MTRFLVSDDNENGYRLEDILTAVRADVVKRCGKIVDDHREEAHHVLENNIRV
ncbi:MAG TPA: histidine kinase, partial [Rhodobiaceae bacterium]|nr:histidine kinase [Rhodobiaceae bacterium]